MLGIDVLFHIEHAAFMLIRLISVSACYSKVNSGYFYKRQRGKLFVCCDIEEGRLDKGMYNIIP
jgi:hypothetical protein